MRVLRRFDARRGIEGQPVHFRAEELVMLLRSRLITARYVARRLQTQNPRGFLRVGRNFGCYRISRILRYRCQHRLLELFCQTDNSAEPGQHIPQCFASRQPESRRLSIAAASACGRFFQPSAYPAVTTACSVHTTFSRTIRARCPSISIASRYCWRWNTWRSDFAIPEKFDGSAANIRFGSTLLREGCRPP